MSEQDIVRAFHVEYYDNYLEIDDFNTINAENEEEARELLLEEKDDESRYTIQETTKAYEINKQKIENLFSELDSV